MLKLLTVILALTLLLSETTKADCDAADEVIKKQDELIKIEKKRNDDLFQQLLGLQSDLVKEQDKNEKSVGNNIVWGVVGVALGVLASSAVRH